MTTSRLKPRLFAWLGSAAAFVGVFLSAVLALNMLRTSDVFWTLLSGRFSRAEDYQLQQIYLPDQRREIAILVVGDSLFHDAIPDTLGGGIVERVVISAFDSDDVVDLFSAMRAGRRATQTLVCNVVVQASPNFLVRARAQGKGQNIGAIRAAQPSGWFEPERAAMTYDVIQRWMKVPDDGGDFRSLPANRVSAHVGQARFADPTLENFGMIRTALPPENVVFVIDDRVTDWGRGSDLVETLPKVLSATEDLASNVTWARLDVAARLPALTCDELSFVKLRELVRAERVK